ncbi:sigma factor [Verrucomicrobiales bacterium BCK34]|nr:sigma factor [Verrucomicrobiales bacterium BCK34]
MSAHFNTTRWSLLLKVKSKNHQEAEVALETLCQSYWQPLYSWLRRSGNSPSEAEDLTQGFFAHAIRTNLFHKAESSKGKLRTFLLTCLKHYLADQHDKNSAAKRANRKNEVSLDFVDSEIGEMALERDLRSRDATPSEIYEYRWARTLLRISLARLEEEHIRKGKEELCRVLTPLLTELDPGNSYAETATALKSNEGAVRIAFHRFKKRFQEIVREEVAKTLLPGETVHDEMLELAEILSRAVEEP